MGTRTVHLHGGPYHGHEMAIPAGHDHFHVRGNDPESTYRGITEDQDNPADIEWREGTYSKVSGPDNKDNFEWDGWVSH